MSMPDFSRFWITLNFPKDCFNSQPWVKLVMAASA